ncbi:eCIS core domain-containing protein [Microbispora sp. CA-102843]|uniref:eCIS core domain-containing protein n=1 Tax=Microbispora sp. CA-102843 TaxID=3239952 RepID=UPI003D8B8B3E
MRGRSFGVDHVAAAKARPVPVQSPRQGGAPSQRDDGRLHPAGEALLAVQRSYGNQHVQRAVIQAKLVVGPPRDRYEREADRVAQAVVRGTTRPGMVGAQSVGGPSSNAPVRAAGGSVAPGLQQDIQQARGHGQSLPEHVRVPMEQALGVDFTDVRLHTDSEADHLSRSLGARAFTSGRDIFLRRGQTDLTGPAGRELIAHELTHVVQQGSGGAGEGVIQRWYTDEDPRRAQLSHEAWHVVQQRGGRL